MTEYIKPEDLKPGQVLTLDVHVMVDTYGCISVSNYHFEDKIYIGPSTVTITVPEDFNATSQAVAVIDAQLDSLANEYHTAKNKLAEKKAQLLQISYGGNEILDAVTQPLYQGNHEHR